MRLEIICMLLIITFIAHYGYVTTMGSCVTAFFTIQLNKLYNLENKIKCLCSFIFAEILYYVIITLMVRQPMISNNINNNKNQQLFIL